MVDFLRRSWAVVDLDCIDYNIRSIKQKLKPDDAGERVQKAC